LKNKAAHHATDAIQELVHHVFRLAALVPIRPLPPGREFVLSCRNSFQYPLLGKRDHHINLADEVFVQRVGFYIEDLRASRSSPKLLFHLGQFRDYDVRIFSSIPESLKLSYLPHDFI